MSYTAGVGTSRSVVRGIEYGILRRCLWRTLRLQHNKVRCRQHMGMVSLTDSVPTTCVDENGREDISSLHNYIIQRIGCRSHAIQHTQLTTSMAMVMAIIVGRSYADMAKCHMSVIQSDLCCTTYMMPR